MRSARNALRHALSIPVERDPALCDAVEGLAREIAGPEATTEIMELARRVAEAQIDLRHVRLAQDQFLSKALTEPDPVKSKTHMRAMANLLFAFIGPAEPDIRLHRLPHLTDSAEQPRPLAEALKQEIKALQALDRYERRILSRREFAIRALDEAWHP